MFKWIAMYVVCCAVAVAAVSNDDLYKEARTLANNKQYDQALLTLERILFRDPLHADALVLQGHIYLWQNEYRKAQKTLSDVVDRTPDYKDAWIALIHSYYRDGKQAKACSTSYQAQNILGRSSVLQMQLKTVCAPQKPEEGASSACRKKTDPIKEQSFTAAAGGKAFQKAFDRYPWANWDFGYTMEKTHWGLNSNLHIQRRKYGPSTFWGTEVDCAPHLKIHPKTVAALRYSFSPYSLFDTIFAQHGITFEVTSGLPAGFEIDGQARFKWYGKTFVPLYILGASKYLKRFLLSSRFFMSVFDSRGYLNNSSQVRYYIAGKEEDFVQGGIAYGLSPFDNGIPTVDGQIAFWEGSISCKFAINNKLAIGPFISVAGEQLTEWADFNNDLLTEKRISEIRYRFTGNLLFYFKM